MAKALPRTTDADIELKKQAFKNAIDDFKNNLGELSETTRGTIFGFIKNRNELVSNAKTVFAEGLKDKLLGLDKKKNENENLIKNSFLTQLLTGKRFIERQLPDDSDDIQRKSLDDSPVMPKSDFSSDNKNLSILDYSPTLVQIEENTKSLVGIFKDSNVDIVSALTNLNSTNIKANELNEQALWNSEVKVKQDAESLKESKNQMKKSNIKNSKIDIKSIPNGGLIGEMMGEILGSSLFLFLSSGKLKKIIGGKLATKAVGKLALRGAGIAGSITAMAMDGIAGANLADEFGTTKVSGAIGGVLAGSDKGILGAMMNMGKWATMGATIGSFVPVVGTFVGGLLGAAFGGLMSLIGAEKIAKFTDSIGGFIGEYIDNLINKFKEFFTWDSDKSVISNVLDKANILGDIFLPGLNVIKNLISDEIKDSIFNFGKKIVNWIKGLFRSDDMDTHAQISKDEIVALKEKEKIIKSSKKLGIDENIINRFEESGDATEIKSAILEVKNTGNWRESKRATKVLDSVNDFDTINNKIKKIKDTKNANELAESAELDKRINDAIKNIDNAAESDNRFNRTRELSNAKDNYEMQKNMGINSVSNETNVVTTTNNTAATIISPQYSPYNLDNTILNDRYYLNGF